MLPGFHNTQELLQHVGGAEFSVELNSVLMGTPEGSSVPALTAWPWAVLVTWASFHSLCIRETGRDSEWGVSSLLPVHPLPPHVATVAGVWIQGLSPGVLCRGATQPLEPPCAVSGCALAGAGARNGTRVLGGAVGVLAPRFHFGV